MRYLLRRLMRSMFLVLGAVFLSFLFAKMAPGSYFDEMRLNPQVSPETVAALHQRYGLDRPTPQRFVNWVGNVVLHGDLGYSYAYNRPVGPMLWQRACNTLLLAIVATAFAWIIAIPLGTWMAVHRGKWKDRALGVAIATLLVVPDILLALGALIFAVHTGLLPVGGMSVLASDSSLRSSSADLLRHMVGPMFVLGLGMFPMLAAHVRSAMSAALESPSVAAAKAHGIVASRIVLRYAMPLAANPIITLFGISLATLLSSTLLVEVIMSWPGLGPFFLEAIFARDLYCVIGTVFISTLFLVGGSMIADMLLYAADPRIRRP